MMRKSLKQFLPDSVIIGLFTFLLLFPWLIYQMMIRINADTAFLYMAAEHILAGHRMVDYFNDNNPPMCYLIYLPATLLHNLGLSIPMAINVYSLFLIFMAGSFVLYYISCQTEISKTSQTAIFAGFILSITLWTYGGFATKDHFIAIALWPFLLAQLSISKKNKIHTVVLFFTFIVFVPFVLIKPHYGLLPVILIIRRLYHEKKFSSLFKMDFMILAAAVCLYALMILYRFPDYISDILVDAFYLYAVVDFGDINYSAITLGFSVFTAFLLFIISFSEKNKKERDFAFFIGSMAFLTLFIFFIQAKGFTLHLYPFFSLFFILVALAVRQITDSNQRSLFGNHIRIICTLLLTVYAFLIISKKFPTHSAYEHSSLARLIQEKAGDQPFFFQTQSTAVIYTQAMYIENVLGSRFSSLAFLNGIFRMQDGPEQNHMLEKYGNFIAEDIARYKPKLIGLLIYDQWDGNIMDNTFKNLPAIQDEWKHYKYDSDFTIYRSELPDMFLDAESLSFKIYIRQD